MQRRKFISLSTLGALSIPLQSFKQQPQNIIKPIVISTWDAGVNANKTAWNILQNGGKALDAVEQGVMVTENENNCCVGLNANPDRDGIVTLDASIMDENGNCGSVAFLERIKHPISVARKVMEKTPHVLLAGEGAQQFAVSQGFVLEKQTLSERAKKAYTKWLKKSEYKPQVNRENIENKNIEAPKRLDDGTYNHDTIGMLALDINGNLSGSCTTSGQGFKMRGRVGDSPLVGAGLFVDNEVGAAVATGQGEEVIRIAGCHLVVEFMRQGDAPEQACKKAIERLIHKRGVERLKDLQVCFIALNKNGEYGGYALQKGFDFAVYNNSVNNTLIPSKYIL
jgi:N4-(beta-N-acetylglucosaminyl)-L-asparaginase